MKATHNDPKRLVFIITGLSTGGAEMMLYKLLSRINREKFEPIVISLMDRGKLGDRIEALGIPVHTIGMKLGKPTPASVLYLINTVRQLKPDLIQGWMYHGNLAAQLASIFIPRSASVLWNVRQSLYSFNYEKKGTVAVIKLCSYLSNLPSKIIYNSRKSTTQHEKIGYNPERTVIIPNGFEIDLFTPSSEAYNGIRQELGLSKSTVLIGLIGRFHPMKDHHSFLQAAALFLKTYSVIKVDFVLAGHGVDEDNQTLCRWVKELELGKQIHLLGERRDIPRLTAALDIASLSSSYAEGFPNIIGEAMSCGVPCVVTNVGDSPWIIGETGKVVPPRNPQALANAWQELIQLGSEGMKLLGKVARRRAMQYFSLDSIVTQYEALYESVLTEELN